MLQLFRLVYLLIAIIHLSTFKKVDSIKNEAVLGFMIIPNLFLCNPRTKNDQALGSLLYQRITSILLLHDAKVYE